jgi:prepilin-type processing-associated H-X9-DG protein
MEENFIGYLLGALDERTSSDVEHYLEEHPEAQEKLAVLEQALAPLEADAESPPPPADLVFRTLARVAEQICIPAPVPTTTTLPKAPPIEPSSLPLGRVGWRRLDVLVAACILVTILGVGLSVLGRLRAPSSGALIVNCQGNLRQFFNALETYRDIHRRFPDVSLETPRNVAGMVVPMLIDAGTLSETASIRCPGIGEPMSCPLTLASLRNMNDEQFTRHSPCLSMCYAYSLGYRDQGGWHAPGTPTPAGSSQTAIMADRPPSEGVRGNSVNHGGAGQNVLFADGHVHFLPERTFGNGDDIFLNRDQRVAAGIDPFDIVLGYSASRP